MTEKEITFDFNCATSCTIKLMGQSIGLIQYEIQKNGSPISLDIQINDTNHTDVGSLALQIFLRDHIFNQYDACFANLDKKNKFAIRTYAKAGFTTVHEMETHIVMEANKVVKRKPIIIFGSSRSNGHTTRAVQAVVKEKTVAMIDLSQLDISPYDYNYENSKDDFIPLAEKMVRHNPIILATPVYWYTMSAIMKAFLDRWSDFLDIRKDIGRRLVNKELFIITSYGESAPPRGFEDAFSQTCDYLDMKYRGCFYFYSGSDQELGRNNSEMAEKFSHQIFNQPTISL